MKILVVSNMYPDKKNPFYGTFVKSFYEQLLSIDNISAELSVMHKADNKISKLFRYFLFYSKTFFKSLFAGDKLIYIHYASYSSLPVILAKKINKKLKVFVNVHGSDVIPENSRQKRMEKYTKQIIQLSDKVIVPSIYFKNIVLDKYKIDKSKVVVYPSGGINNRIFNHCNKEQRIKVLEDIGLNPSFRTFGMVSRISYGKGWDVFLHAISICNKNNMKANYLIVGDGPESDQMEELIKKLNLTQVVTVIGLQDQYKLSQIYNALDFLVFPTERAGESLGLVALEALSCGCPVISSNYAAPKYYIKNSINGYKFDKGNTQQLSDIMKKCNQITKDKYQSLSNESVKSVDPYLAINITKTLKTILFN